MPRLRTYPSNRGIRVMPASTGTTGNCIPGCSRRHLDPEAGDGSADAIDAKPGGLLAVLGANDPAARVVQPALPERS